MIYPDNFENKTGFDQVRTLVRSYCLFQLGLKRVDEMKFSNDFGIVKRNLDLTAEFKEICLLEDDFPVENYYDLTGSLQKSKIEGTHMVVDEVIQLKRSLDTLRAILHFFKKAPQEKYLTLKDLTRDIKYYPFVNERIEAILSKQGKIRDNASPELKMIREEINRKQAASSKILQQLLKKAIAAGWVENDSMISIRNGRQVIPIPVSNKRKLSGIIHDESATGRTAYVEPSAIVELNNDIRDLELAEESEIIRILIAFTTSIRPYIDDLMQAYEFLGHIDFIRAKALFAISI